MNTHSVDEVTMSDLGYGSDSSTEGYPYSPSSPAYAPQPPIDHISLKIVHRPVHVMPGTSARHMLFRPYESHVKAVLKHLKEDMAYINEYMKASKHDINPVRLEQLNANERYLIEMFEDIGGFKRSVGIRMSLGLSWDVMHPLTNHSAFIREVLLCHGDLRKRHSLCLSLL